MGGRSVRLVIIWAAEIPEGNIDELAKIQFKENARNRSQP